MATVSSTGRGAQACPAFDHHDESVRGDDYFKVYDHLRKDGVRWSAAHGGFWVISRYADVRAALRDHETFSSAGGCFLPDLGYRSAALEQDPPEHRSFRKLYVAAVGRAAVLRYEAALAAMIRRVVDDFADGGGGEARAGIAEKVPVEAVALMFGLSPTAAAQIRELTVEAWKRMSEDPDCLKPLARVLLDEVEAKRRDPADDFLTELADAEVEGRRLPDGEIANVLVGAVIAGHETTMNASTNLMLELAIDPELQEDLRADPDTISAVVEETLRHRAPIHLFFRTVTRTTAFAGAEMQAGDKVALLYASANRDVERFAEPDAVCPARASNAHLSFGWGIHRCVGAFMAQTELRILTETLLARGSLALDGEPEPAPLEGGHHMGFRRLSIRITPPITVGS